MDTISNALTKEYGKALLASHTYKQVTCGYIHWTCLQTCGCIVIIGMVHYTSYTLDPGCRLFTIHTEDNGDYYWSNSFEHLVFKLDPSGPFSLHIFSNYSVFDFALVVPYHISCNDPYDLDNFIRTL